MYKLLRDEYKLLRDEYKLLHKYYKLLREVYKLLHDDYKLLHEGKVYQLINGIDCMTFRKGLLTSVTNPKKTQQ